MNHTLLNTKEITDLVQKNYGFFIRWFYVHNSAFKKIVDKYDVGLNGRSAISAIIKSSNEKFDLIEVNLKRDIIDNYWFSFEDVLFVAWNTRIKQIISVIKDYRQKRNTNVAFRASLFKRYPVCEWWCDLDSSTASSNKLEYIVLTHKRWFGEKITRVAEFSRTAYNSKQSLKEFIAEVKSNYMQDANGDLDFITWYEPSQKISIKSFKDFICECKKHGMKTDEEIKMNVYNALRQHSAWICFCRRKDDETLLSHPCKMLDCEA